MIRIVRLSILLLFILEAGSMASWGSFCSWNIADPEFVLGSIVILVILMSLAAFNYYPHSLYIAATIGGIQLVWGAWLAMAAFSLSSSSIAIQYGDKGILDRFIFTAPFILWGMLPPVGIISLAFCWLKGRKHQADQRR